MKNITLKVDDETYRNARIRAAEQGSSVSAMVRAFLASLPLESEQEAHARRVASLEKLYREADERARLKPPEQKPIKPLTRDEIYAERLR